MNFTSEQIKDLKAKHGEIFLVEMKGDDNQSASFIIKTPSRKVLDLVAHHGVKKDVFASNKALISNCVIEGDLELMESDGGIYTALLEQIQKLIKKKETEVKKL